MKRACQKGLSILLVLCMMLGLLPGITSHVAADGALTRSQALDLTTATSDIPDTGEGWSWNNGTKTLVLNGMNLQTDAATPLLLPFDSTIVLADGSVNTVATTYTGTSLTRGIHCTGSLTIQGTTGTLNITSGVTTATSSTMGLSSGKNLTILGGTINALAQSSGYSSIGIYAVTSVIISGGTVTATGSTSASSSVGILASSSVSITGATVTTTGNNGTQASFGIQSIGTAIFSRSTIYAKSGTAPTTHAVMALDSITDTGMVVLQNNASDYTLPAVKYQYYYDSEWLKCYVYNTNTFATDIKIAPQPGATVSDKTLSGMMGTDLSDSDTVTLTLTDCNFINLSQGDTVSTWFSNLPEGIKVTAGAVSSNAASVELTFSGNPTSAYIGAMSIAIPGEKLSTGSNIAVTPNSNAKFNILHKRTTALDLTAGSSISYITTSGSTGGPISASSNITNTVEGWSWYKNASGTYAANTLVLNDIRLVTGDAIALKLPANSIIVLSGDSVNSITSEFNGIPSAITNGINCEGALEIQGTGTLNVASGIGNFNSSLALSVTGNLTISGGTINSTGGQAEFDSIGVFTGGSTIVTGGTLTAIGSTSTSSFANSYGIYSVVNVVFSGSTTYAKAGSVPVKAYAVYAQSDITDSNMTILQKASSDYTVATVKQDNDDCSYYTYGEQDAPATDIRISETSFSGTGTDQDPYLISSAAQLKEMSNVVNSKNSSFGNSHYKLTGNIVLNNDISNNPQQWSPIGADYSTPFTGIFDGNGNTIRGLYIDDSTSYSSLFGYVRGGTVKNVGLTGGYIASDNAFSFSGGIVGFNHLGTIEDCYSSSTVTGAFAGGIAGFNLKGHIQDCYNTGVIFGPDYSVVGGIVGENIDADLTIVNCYNTGSVAVNVTQDNTAYVGGIAGRNTESSIKNCYNSGTLSANGAIAYVGGITGNSQNGTIENAYWLDSTADTGIAENLDVSSSTVNTTAMTAADMKAATFVETLNTNADALRTTYGTLSPWKADRNSANGGYPVFGTESSSGNPDNPGNPGNPGGSGSSGNPGSSGNSNGADETVVLLNGQSKSAGTTKTETGSDGRKVTTVTVDSTKLKVLLASESSGAKVTIPVTSGADTVVGSLTGEMIRSMEDKAATLIIQTGSSSYTLPASEINIGSISQQLGANVSLSDITVSVSISQPSDTMTKVVEGAGKNAGFTIMAPSVDFSIRCTYGEKTVDVSVFNAYVERTIAIPEGVDPSKITTGVVVEPNGTVRHVPTQVTVIDGKYYAVINSLTNSTYSVVWNPVEFSDVAKHWAKDSINNMGSRMVVTGIGNNTYNPNREITRAEFATIVVRALGLGPGMGSSSFSDVDESKWYSGYIKTAVSYGIINGYNAKNFGPNDTITREQAITMIARAMKTTGLNATLSDSEIGNLLAAYNDGAKVSGYAANGMAVCLKTGIVSGRAGNMLAPKANITRAEAAVIIEKLLRKSALI